jgi:DNA mismatch endonuclease (patch repair protein)
MRRSVPRSRKRAIDFRAEVANQQPFKGNMSRCSLGVTDDVTSRRLARVRQAGTRPELAVRTMAYSLGLRYRVCNRDICGSPDLANRRRKWCIFVHGCFWHRHAGCSRATTPKRNRRFWQNKFEANVRRDARVLAELRRTGWHIVIIWECQLAGSVRSPNDKLRRLAHSCGKRDS